MIDTIVVLAALVFFPLLPAYLLFKLLPSSAETTGGAGDMKMKLGGAFGGYVALFVILGSYYAKVIAPATEVESWTVKGHIPIDRSVDRAKVAVTLRPPKTEIREGNSFTIDFDIPRRLKHDAVLAFEVPGYSPASVELFSDDPHAEAQGTAKTVTPMIKPLVHEIRLGEIELVRNDDYKPTTEAVEIKQSGGAS